MLEIFAFDPAMRTQTQKNPYFDECYRAWKEIWNEEYLRLDPEHKWSSDTFTRQSTVVAIFYNKSFAASVLYRPLDLRSKIDRDDSFLSHWPTKVVDDLARINPVVLVCTSYTVAKDFRKNQVENHSMKDLLAALTIYYFKKSGYPLTIGLTRNTRKVNEHMASVGWESLGTIDFNNEPSEMFYCKAESPLVLSPEVIHLFENALSSRRSDSINMPAESAA